MSLPLQSFKERRLHPDVLWRLIENAMDRRHVLGDAHPDASATLRSLVHPYEAWGKPEQMANWRPRPPESAVVKDRSVGHDVSPGQDEPGGTPDE
ncbi:MAG TPA: hypothetical protein VM243_04965 [Phycisphaerae bacterium]|nr:hypothetical protein [Phycisphaerae bacterium]